MHTVIVSETVPVNTVKGWVCDFLGGSIHSAPGDQAVLIRLPACSPKDFYWHFEFPLVNKLYKKLEPLYWSLFRDNSV